MTYRERPTSFLVLDIETVPDLTFWTPELEAEEEESPKKTKKKDKIPPAHAHRPVAIGCVWLDAADLTTRRIGCIGASKHGDDERKILTDWNSFMEEHRPTIVTWNGRTFDMPVLALRSFRWGIRQKWYDKGYRYRYDDEWHLDLLDVMTDYGSVNKAGFKLDNIARIAGMPGKYGMDGSQVDPMYKAGRIEEIETYVQTDVIQTAAVLMRFLLTRGKITLELYRSAAAKLVEATKAQPRFEEFCSLINEKLLMIGD